MGVRKNKVWYFLETLDDCGRLTGLCYNVRNGTLDDIEDLENATYFHTYCTAEAYAEEHGLDLGTEVEITNYSFEEL
jgi:hypothetical protein